MKYRVVWIINEQTRYGKEWTDLDTARSGLNFLRVQEIAAWIEDAEGNFVEGDQE